MRSKHTHTHERTKRYFRYLNNGRTRDGTGGEVERSCRNACNSSFSIEINIRCRNIIIKSFRSEENVLLYGTKFQISGELNFI